MDGMLKMILGAVVGIVLAVAGLTYYGLSLMPAQNFEYDNATETAQAEYLNSIGDFTVLMMKSKFKGDVASVEGVNTDERQVYLNLYLDALMRGKKIPSEVVHSPEFASLVERQFNIGIAQNCRQEKMHKFFEQDLSLLITLQMSGQTITDLELSKSACAEAIG